jgi:hypothetical protein
MSAGFHVASDYAAGGETAAKRDAFLGGPDDDFEWVPGADASAIERLDGAEAASEPRSPSKLPPLGY